MNPLLNNPQLLFKSLSTDNKQNTTVILGGGLAGLSAGFMLVKAGQPVMVIESEPAVGGLSKTIVSGTFRFDLGGHRFITKNQRIKNFVNDLLVGELLTVNRKSKIYMRNKFFDYPLRPSNALFGLGISTTFRAISDYSKEKIKSFLGAPDTISLEDWVVSNFGRTMFNLYFKEYSEKVWGIECSRISKDWLTQRIKGLSLWVAIKNAFFKFSGQEVDTLADKFIYPATGIGLISDRLKEAIEAKNAVLTDTRAIHINHKDFVVKSVIARNCGQLYDVEGAEFISSIPLTNLVQMFTPSVPVGILEAASHLRYRDLVIVTIMLKRERITDLTWLYLPEKDIPLGRIHEPKNWSPKMAPEGKTHIVSEYYCFEGDKIWDMKDEELIATTVNQLERLGFVSKKDVIGSCVVRVPKAYPLFEIDYTEYYDKILNYLRNFKNLHTVGRGGMFRYYNMDHAIESGISVAERIIKKEVKKL